MQFDSGRFITGMLNPGNPSQGIIDTDNVQLGNTQQWMMISHTYQVVSFQHVATGRILDVTSSNGLIGTYPSLPTYDGNISSEDWKIQKVAFQPKLSGVYRITNSKTGRVLQGPMSDGSLSTQPKKVMEATQYWAILPIEGDVCEVYSNISEQVLRDKNGVHLDEKDTTIHAMDGMVSLIQSKTLPVPAARHPTEQWLFKWIEGDEFYMQNAGHSPEMFLTANSQGDVYSQPINRDGLQIW
jgi:hypothetical protein